MRGLPLSKKKQVDGGREQEKSRKAKLWSEYKINEKIQLIKTLMYIYNYKFMHIL